MLENFSTVVSIVISVAAFFISVYNLYLNKSKMTAEFIAKNRMEWIKDVRKLMYEFIASYYKKEGEECLRLCQAKISMYTRKNSEAYARLDEQLEICINNEFNMQDYNILIEECQNVLNDVWRRLKLESGMNSAKDKKIQDIIRNKA